MEKNEAGQKQDNFLLTIFFNSNQMQDFKMTKLFAQIWI